MAIEIGSNYVRLLGVSRAGRPGTTGEARHVQFLVQGDECVVEGTLPLQIQAADLPGFVAALKWLTGDVG